MSAADLAGSAARGPVALLQDTVGLYSAADIGLAVVLVLLAFAAPHWGAGFYARLEDRTTRLLGQHPLRQILAVGALALLARAALLPWLGAPAFVVHDENSLLLQAQTYLQGRLANPTHPFWAHFESFHINQVPAYASMYFPGRGAPLAAGLLLGGDPWLGVWLSFVLMSMAAVWMLQAWVSLPMALLGGVLVVARFGLFSYWVNSYWGGAFTALGGMLVIGALPRILKQPRWREGVLLGLGILILMTTRPYEGALLCMPAAALVLWRLAGPLLAGRRLQALKVALPAVACVVVGAALLGLYNQATTGHLLKTPYSLNREAYATAPAFLISPPIVSQQRGPAYFREFYKAEAAPYERRGTLKETVRSLVAKVFHSWNFYVGAIFSAAFLAGLWAVRRQHFLTGTLAFFYAGYVIETWNFPHYTAPLYPVVLIVMMRGFEWLRTFSWRGRSMGLFLTRAMPTAAVAILVLPLAAVVLGKSDIGGNPQSTPCCALSDDNLRSRLIRQLREMPGQDLVLVKDGPNNPLHFEFVYNEADIDRAPIVWAHSLGAERDLALQHYFAGRRVWAYEWRPDTVQGYRLDPVSPVSDPK